MISCAYALLFSNEGYLYGPSSFSNLRLNQPEETPKVSALHSLVILGDGFRNSFYGAYEFPSDGQFPIPDAKFGIAKTQDKSHRSDTKVVAYCSPTLSSMEIIEKTYCSESRTMLQPESHCLDEIYEDQRQILKNSPTPPRELAQNDKCSSRDIISLAHRGLISIAGVYSTMVPTHKNNIPRVYLKGTVALEEILTRNEIVGSYQNDKMTMALVWYFGHLHLFQKDRGTSIWWPKTKIEVENSNGAMIINFMRHRMKIFKELDNRIARYGLAPNAVDCFPFTRCTLFEMKKKTERDMAEIRQLGIENQSDAYYNFLYTRY
ncbi:BgTH12-07659 [Blumeria graminis f. sp. triticale]|uniref:BgTH12-07659 n=1 Tax=Blumeria graminis f. sp. triticale TaxID=1689686 RepID=A0A9W4GDH5_BLUGR|nr:BgTH12-07659 [Blumeria graminis f. sp. triticale]